MTRDFLFDATPDLPNGYWPSADRKALTDALAPLKDRPRYRTTVTWMGPFRWEWTVSEGLTGRIVEGPYRALRKKWAERAAAEALAEVSAGCEEQR